MWWAGEGACLSEIYYAAAKKHVTFGLYLIGQ